MKLLQRKGFFIGSACLASFVLGGFVVQKAEEEKLTTAVIQQAEKLIGIDFTDSEADSMLSNLEDQRKDYAELRKLSIANAVSPALVFNPVPPGYEFPDKTSGFSVKETRGVRLPENRDELAYYSIGELAALLKSRQITSVELTRFFLDRLKRNEGSLHHVITYTEELALKQAAQADAELRAGKYRGLLHGIPYGAKDLLVVDGYRTTFGAAPYRDQVLSGTATVVERLTAAGAVLIAKTSLGALAMGDVWFGGKTRNPWNVKRGSSGSSAGSASAVAAGCMPFAIGSETLGSIVSPSTECGTTGLRPTFGRVSKAGAMALSWSMDKIGPIARNVEDLAIVFSAIHGEDGKDLSVVPAPFSYRSPAGSLKGYRIGYVKKDFERRYSNRANDSLTLAKLRELGAELVPLELPNMPYGAMTLALSAEAAAAFDELTLTNRDDQLVRQDKNSWPNYFRSARFIPAVEYIQANRARSLLISEMAARLKGLDLYVAPSFTASLTATNLSGHPCVVLPNGVNREGLPASITFLGQLFGEGKLLQAAQVYQSATGFHKKHPSLNF